ncbi:MAG: ATP-binding protein [Desulfitobacteriaceae bacterium]|nr:ATP-binding protein [Desulfitobacteriaceae bacterium]
MNRQIYEAKLALESLTVYRGLLEDRVIKAFSSILQDATSVSISFSQLLNHYSEFYYALVEANPESTFEDYLIEKIIYADNFFSRRSEKVSLENLSESLKKAVERDLNCLQIASGVTAGLIKEEAFKGFAQSKLENDLLESLPEWSLDSGDKPELTEDREGVSHSVKIEALCAAFKASQSWSECLQPLVCFIQQNGSGQFARYQGFIWEKNGEKGVLQGVSAPDPIRFGDLIGYERQRQEIINNTEQLLNGYAANNVLLYGDRGTGKSATVKALLNEYGRSGLRVIELPQDLLDDLPQVIRIIKERQQKFIIFIDDLAFGDSEEEYTALKAVLEGSLESKPQNVVIYATSNRRHLIKEKFSDRSGLRSGNEDDEVRSADTLQEKLSLADRFGITIIYPAPDQEEYLEIVEGLARNRGLAIDLVTLHEEALKWEINHNGRSPRTARQFMDWLEAHVEKL